MMNTRNSLLVLIALAALGLPACKQQTPGTPAPPGADLTEAPTGEAGAPTAEATGEAPDEVELTFGAGPFDLPDPAAGLDALASYTATLRTTFEGTYAGEAASWDPTLRLVVSDGGAIRVKTVEGSGAPGVQPAPSLLADVAGVLYLQQEPGGRCTTRSIPAAEPAADDPLGGGSPVTELARALLPALGAEPAGSEAVGGVETDHYTFDESAMVLAREGDASGEVWVAQDGGYVVKYTLTVTGGADYFGEGGEGTATWDYELTDINAGAPVELPAECPPLQVVDAPLPEDAADVLRLPGVMTFNTQTSLADIAAFYQEQLPALGWQAPAAPIVAENLVVLDFTQGEQVLSVLAAPDDDGGGNTVRLLLTSPAAAPAPTPGG